MAKARKQLYDKIAPVSTNIFQNIASGANLSGSKMASVAKEFRSSQERKSIEPGMKETLQNAPLVLKKFFTTIYIPLQVRNKETKLLKEVNVKLFIVMIYLVTRIISKR